MKTELPKIQLPPAIVEQLRHFSAYFPDKVRWDSEEKSVHVTEQMPPELQLAMAFMNLAGDVGDVVENLKLVLDDIETLPARSILSHEEASRRYFLSVRLFFYELLRIRDALPRFFKRLEGRGVMSKGERREARKVFDEVLSELYLVRNVLLHADSFPLSDDEFDLRLMATAASSGYDMTPLPGTKKMPFQELLGKLADWRRSALTQVATEVIAICQRLVDSTAAWVVAKHFPKAEP